MHKLININKSIYRPLIYIIFVLFFLNFFGSTISAHTPDESELKQLLTDTFDIYVEFDRNFDDIDEESIIELYSIDELLMKIDPYVYFARRVGEFRKFNDFKEALYSCVTPDIGDYFIKSQHILNIDGYTYSCTVQTQAQNQGIWFEPTELGSEGFEHFDLDSTFEVVSVTDDKIEAKFLLYFFDPYNQISEFTVEYAKTTDGWRICGGTFVSDILNPPYQVVYPDQAAPQTGTDAFAYAAVAVAALAAAVVVKKRRRRV